MPPESLCGYSSIRLLGRGDVDAAQQLDGALARLPPRAAAVAQDGLDDLVADGEARIERGHRLLEDHRQPVAAQVAQGFVGDIEQIEAVEADRAGDLGGVLWQQPHDGERGHALAAAGFADEAERRAVGDAEVDAVDRMRGAAVVAVEDDAQALDLDQRACRHALARHGRFDAGVDDGAVGDPGRIAARRQELAEMHPALAADLFQPFELGERIGVVVDAQVEIGPFLLAVDQQRGRLLAALVAAGGFAGLHRRDQPLREGQGWRWRRRRCAVSSSTAGAGQHVAGDRKAVALDVPAPVDAVAPRMGGDAAAGVHDVKLPALAAGVGGDQRVDDLARRFALRAAASRRRCRNRD